MAKSSPLEADTGIGSRRVGCVLIYPPWTVVLRRTFLTNNLPPLGILSIAASLEQRGFSVRVIDVHAERLSPHQVREQIQRHRSRYAGIAVLSSMVAAAHALATLGRKEVSDCMVVMGGVHAELFPERMLQNSAVDLVVRGDGEDPTVEILGGRPWSEIQSVSFVHQNRSVQHNPLRPIEMNLDRYPMPAYHLVDFSRYFPSATSYRNLPL